MKKGIILAGGSGTRLHPITKAVCKQLLPIYDKPMIYYPLATLMTCDIQDVLVIVSSEINKTLFSQLLGGGEDFGINISYEIQEKPGGIAQAFLVGEKFINNEPVTLVLGDNIFFGETFEHALRHMTNMKYSGSLSKQNMIFGYKVKNPKAYGVAVLDDTGALVTIEEKPKNPRSDYAVPGLYMYDDTVVARAKALKPSARGELEITDLNNAYINDGQMEFIKLMPGTAWFDTGTHDHLLESSHFVKAIQSRTGMMVGDPKTVAKQNGWIE